ncbi:MAG TPA: OmpH family outer membrane protein [Syntrophorhabdaceae bacterium]|nr:OmpH family outer membrane protein [Syntrophorhabdaceae bacterium]HPP05804.1 OmpH family outer membrane protein [Syntrophorhabdaceae bacterium]
MKKNLFVLIASLIIVFASNIVCAQQVSIAYVDIGKVIMESDKGKQAKKTMDEEIAKIRKDLSSKQEELQKLKDSIDKQGAALKPEVKEEKQKLYNKKLKDYQNLENEYQGDMQQKIAEFEQKLVNEIMEVIKKIGDEGKYTVILQKHPAIILYAAPSIDITNKVIEVYNKQAKEKTNK